MTDIPNLLETLRAEELSHRVMRSLASSEAKDISDPVAGNVVKFTKRVRPMVGPDRPEAA